MFPSWQHWGDKFESVHSWIIVPHVMLVKLNTLLTVFDINFIAAVSMGRWRHYTNPRTNLGPEKEETDAPPKTKTGLKVREGGREREKTMIIFSLLLPVSYPRVVVG
jgi:hypothetical protein